MKLDDLRRNWDAFGRTDPHWAVLTDPAQKGGRWDEDAFYRTGVDDVTRLMERLALLGLPARRERALDFGCGVGRIALPLAAHFREVVGVDIAESMLERARRRDPEHRVRFVANVAPHLALFADATFDFIHCRLVLQHIPPPLIRGYLREFVRITRPGGTILFQLPTPGLYRLPDNRYLRLVPPPAVRVYRRVKRIARYLLWPSAPPVMDDYGLTKEETIALLERHRARLVQVETDQSHGPNRPGYEYLAIREADLSSIGS